MLAVPNMSRMGMAIFASGLLLVACQPQDKFSEEFFENMSSLCDRTVEGRVVSEQPADADWIGQRLVLGPVTCKDDVIFMPLAVGEDSSRTWVLAHYPEDMLEFRHRHTEPDGSPSAVTEYGGYNDTPPWSPDAQAFPADVVTKKNFTENGIARSNTNVWTFRFSPNEETLTYQLARPATDTDPARDFRAEFDL